MATEDSELPQRISRRLLTNPADYIWHTSYGAGLANYVGEPYSQAPLESLISLHLRFEPLVARSPTPEVTAAQFESGVFSTASATIHYRAEGTGLANSVVLELDRSVP